MLQEWPYCRFLDAEARRFLKANLFVISPRDDDGGRGRHGLRRLCKASFGVTGHLFAGERPIVFATPVGRRSDRGFIVTAGGQQDREQQCPLPAMSPIVGHLCTPRARQHAPGGSGIGRAACLAEQSATRGGSESDSVSKSSAFAGSEVQREGEPQAKRTADN